VATNTTNINLVKPDVDEFYDVNIFNTNMDTIDTAVKTVDDKVDNLVAIGYGIAYGETTGVANTYLVDLAHNPTSYFDGMAIAIKVHADSTGPSTLDADGLGAIPLKKANGSDLTNMKANGIYTFRYNEDTANFIVQGEGASGNAQPSDLITGKTASTDNGEIIGTMPDKRNANIELVPTTVDQPIEEGYYGGSLIDALVKGDVDLIASNIKSGIDIFGVVGTLDIASLGGKKFATGSVVIPNTSPVTVTGIGFLPKVIIFTIGGLQNSGGVYWEGVTPVGGTNIVGEAAGVGRFNSVSNGQFTINSSRGASATFQWIAFD
jgi:hypothetical protein